MPQDAFETATPPIRRPDAPNHLMWVKPVVRRIRVRAGDALLAETTEAVRVLEIGKDLYDPMLYLPMASVVATLRPSERSTHCPLKGDASYFDWVDAGGAVQVESIAWSYQAALEFAQVISGRIAFYPQHVTIEDAPI